MEMSNFESNKKEETLLSTDFNDLTIIYRHFRAIDGPALIRLEDEASQHFTFMGLVKAGTIHRESFDMKSRCFKDHVILVAEAIPKNGSKQAEICGGVCLGIKEMYFSGEVRKAGVLFDLRVSERYQRRGIGSNICNLLEKIAANRGCDFIYLSVNNHNDKAIFLYDKLGYDMISSRRILHFSIPNQRNEVAEYVKEIRQNGKNYQLLYERLGREDTLKYYTQFYSGQDLALKNWEEMVDSPNYLGTYAVRTSDNKNIAGMSLWKSKKSGSMGIRKLFFDISYYNKIWFIALGLAIFYGLLGGSLNSLRNWPQSWGLGNFWTKIASFLLPAIPIWLFNYLYLTINQKIQNFGGYSVRGRVIGPFTITKDDEISQEMLNFLSERLGTTAANEDISSCIYNCDSQDTYATKLPGISRFGGSTRFMGKILKDGIRLKNYKISKNAFFDPRDL